jgi:hypothetical protein
VLLHVEPFQVAPPASALNVSSAGRGVSMWPIAVTAPGTLWQSLQAMSLRHVDGARWLRCAPTVRRSVVVPPVVSFGGAGLPPLPWHESQG